LAAAVALCLSATAVAQDTTTELVGDRSAFSPFTLTRDSAEAVAGTPAAPVQLRLDQPFSLAQFGEAILGQNGAARSSGSALSYQLGEALSLTGGVTLAETNDFQSLGSIHCENGVLDAVSYRASNCYFIDDGGRSTASAVAIGTRLQPARNVQASLNLFREQQNTVGTLRSAPFLGTGNALTDPLGIGIGAGSNSLGGLDPMLAGPGFSSTERTGVDLEFQVGVSTDKAGDMVLGLQLTRVLDSGLEGVFYASPGARNWTIASPYDSARLSLDWNRGPFSGGIDSYYRSAVSFIDRTELESQATFDVHFTWRAPWNASLSVGASNVMGAGKNDSAAQEPAIVDPFESIYGRIPYVRYKQDL